MKTSRSQVKRFFRFSIRRYKFIRLAFCILRFRRIKLKNYHIAKRTLNNEKRVETMTTIDLNKEYSLICCRTSAYKRRRIIGRHPNGWWGDIKDKYRYPDLKSRVMKTLPRKQLAGNRDRDGVYLFHCPSRLPFPPHLSYLLLDQLVRLGTL